MKTLVARTLKGDGKAATLLLSMMTRWLDAEEAPRPPDVVPEIAPPLNMEEIAEVLEGLAAVTGWRLIREPKRGPSGEFLGSDGDA